MTIKKKPAELLKSSGFLPFSIRPRLKRRGYSILCYGRPGCYIVKKNKMNAKAPAGVLPRLKSLTTEVVTLLSLATYPMSKISLKECGYHA
ncbi:MAG TPA: hypothetical protein DEF89_05545 [Desulfosporosinus sp.]|nr:hypothetical protein [Desulfosporosinus sp.]